MQKIIVVIPTFNEANNIPVLTAELWALQIPGLFILIIDDDSPDGTGRIADELAHQRPGELFVLHQKGKRGLRRAYISGFKWALAHDADFIFQMDSDFSHSPSYILEMLEAIRDADVVVGSRYVAGGRFDERMGAARYLLSLWANAIYIRFILSLKVNDTTTGYKCWRSSALRSIDLNAIASDGYSFQIEMAYVAEKLGLRIVEIPIYFEDRRIGRTKLTFRSKVEAVFRAWDILWRYRDFPPAADESNAVLNPEDAGGAQDLERKM
jgi:dolichol-phosphate mannosyltransferase